ncbi:MAG: sensor histidine kinase, partial [Promicromonosporaceae bacterium]|nr:sensor histidine kinase [Promicromonosporaceae bacterium]
HLGSLSLLGVAALLSVALDGPGWHTWLEVAGVVILAAAYLLLGVPALGTGARGRTTAYMAVMIVVVPVVSVYSTAGVSLQLLGFFHCWVFAAGRRRRGLAYTLLLMAGLSFAVLASLEFHIYNWLTHGLWTGIVLMVSILAGLALSQAMLMSARNAQLLAEVSAVQARLVEQERGVGAQRERERMAREVHDTLAQGFTSTGVLAVAALGAIEDGDLPAARLRLEQIKATADENFAEARALVTAGLPAVLGDQPLDVALRRLADRWMERTGLPLQLSLDRADALSANTKAGLLRIAQEALTNVHRHARATRASVTLLAEPTLTTLTVIDDGIGRDPLRPDGHGLAGMRERAQAIGAELSLTDGPGGRGTVVAVAAPVPAPALKPAVVPASPTTKEEGLAH